MKRIANDVAVQTICYTISGIQKIRIVDYESEYDLITSKEGKTVYEGLLKDAFYKCEYNKWFESKCWGLIVDGDTLVFEIYTKYEQYK